VSPGICSADIVSDNKLAVDLVQLYSYSDPKSLIGIASHTSRGNGNVFHELPNYSKHHLCPFPWLAAPFLVALYASVLNTNFLSPDSRSHPISGTWHKKSVLLLPLVALTHVGGGTICTRHIMRRRRDENLHHSCPQMGQQQSTSTVRVPFPIVNMC
jgi:hypothetical protein